MSHRSPASSGAPAGPDRRRFLQLTGLGLAGVAAIGTLDLVRAATAHAGTDAISLGNRINELVVADFGSGFQWAEQCQRAQYFAEWAATGTEPGPGKTYGNALSAYHASHIESKDMATAPAGSFSYYNASADGHDVLNIGNGYCINTSPKPDGTHFHDFGHGLYISRLDQYTVGPYLGWSYTNGVNPRIDVAPWSPDGSGGGAGWAWNAPDQATQKRIQQALANRKRYSGPIDGVWGTNTIKGIQTTCKNVGYTGPIDGVPGKNTCHYVQVYARKYGSYTGPVDDVLGPNSWNGFALGLERP